MIVSAFHIRSSTGGASRRGSGFAKAINVGQRELPSTSPKLRRDEGKAGFPTSGWGYSTWALLKGCIGDIHGFLNSFLLYCSWGCKYCRVDWVIFAVIYN